MESLDELKQQAENLEQNMDKNNPEETLNSINSLLASLEEKLETIFKSITKE